MLEESNRNNCADSTPTNNACLSSPSAVATRVLLVELVVELPVALAAVVMVEVVGWLR